MSIAPPFAPFESLGLTAEGARKEVGGGAGAGGYEKAVWAA